MKRLFIYCCLISIAFSTACKKVELDPQDGNPVFNAEAEFNGTDIQWQAGIDDYYMYTSFEKDGTDVYEFIGSIAKTDSLKNESIRFRIRDSKTTSEGPTDIESAINPNIEFLFASNSMNDTIWKLEIDTIWSTTFDASTSIIPNSPILYQWDFGDSIADSSDIPVITHQYQFLPNQPVTLNLSAINGTCSSSLTKHLAINGNTAPCSMSFNIQQVNPGNFENGYLLTAIPTGTAPFTYFWSNGNSSNAVILLDSINQLYSASVTVTDANGCTANGSVNSSFTPGILPSICVAAFNNSPLSIDSLITTTVVDTIILGDSLDLSKVIIEYTDRDGSFYSSKLQAQPSFAFFELNSIEDYDDNEKGEKTKKLYISFACRIWDVNGNFIDVKNGKAIIAIAYP